MLVISSSFLCYLKLEHIQPDYGLSHHIYEMWYVLLCVLNLGIHSNMNNKQSYHAFLKQVKEHKQKVVKEIETQQEEMEMQQAKEEKKARKEMKNLVSMSSEEHLHKTFANSCAFERLVDNLQTKLPHLYIIGLGNWIQQFPEENANDRNGHPT